MWILPSCHLRAEGLRDSPPHLFHDGTTQGDLDLGEAHLHFRCKEISLTGHNFFCRKTISIKKKKISELTGNQTILKGHPFTSLSHPALWLQICRSKKNWNLNILPNLPTLGDHYTLSDFWGVQKMKAALAMFLRSSVCGFPT